VLSGSGAAVGRALVSHPGIDMVTFTGGTSSGRAIGAIAAARPYRRCWNWAASRPTLFSTMRMRNWRCRRRVRPVPQLRSIVHRRIAHFRACENLRSIRAAPGERGCRAARGRPVRPEDGGGPGGQLRTPRPHRGLCGACPGEGARVLCGGARPTDSALARGAYVMPTILELDDGNWQRGPRGNLRSRLPACCASRMRLTSSGRPTTRYTVWPRASDARLQARAARRQANQGRHPLDQHLQTHQSQYALWWIQGQRRRPRTGSTGHEKLHAAEGLLFRFDG